LNLIRLLTSLLLIPALSWAQHRVSIRATYDESSHSFTVDQQLTYRNQSDDTLRHLIVNDWNNAYSSKTTPLAERFSDEFKRAFYYAREEERGFTDISHIISGGKSLQWKRPDGHPDLVSIQTDALFPGDSVMLFLRYKVKLPNKRFTRFGYDADGGFAVRDIFLLPALYRDGFRLYSNEDLDDAALARADIDLRIVVPDGWRVESDLTNGTQHAGTYGFTGNNRAGFSIYASKRPIFHSFRNSKTEVLNSLEDVRLDDITKAILVDRIATFTTDYFGIAPKKIVVSQEDYERNPFYGLNQLPRFLNTFSDVFVYELKFLKTYLNAYLRQTLHLDPRAETWIYDGLQTYAMMRYIDEVHPGAKMTGHLGNFRLLQNYNVTSTDFNSQYRYLYLLMARKNLDQPAGDPKNTFLKFNGQIAAKYRSGLNFRHLGEFIGEDTLQSIVRSYVASNLDKPTSEEDLRRLISQTQKPTDWFFETSVHSREIIDYKITSVEKKNDSLLLNIRNRTGAEVPVPLYGLNRKNVVHKQWLPGFQGDTLVSIPADSLDKVVLNYDNEIPEFNQRNNFRSLKSVRIGNRPFKFVLFKDLEDPYYNQVLYVPTMAYNYYDGLTPGLRFYNRTILEKPFYFDINPAYSTNTQSFAGSGAISVQHFYRDRNLYHIRYSASANYFHYTPDATYLRLVPTVLMRFRPDDLRDNLKQSLMIRQVTVSREPTKFLVDDEDAQNYSVFNARFGSTRDLLTTRLSYGVDFQSAGDFGKVSGEFQWRKLLEDNRQLTFRLFAGSFLYNNTDSGFFNFALDRPTDYLFDYNYYGRSETTGLFSQQLIMAEGGFKSRLDVPYADDWMATTNVGFGIWNWIEAYADAGWVKNSGDSPRFLYDSGIRLNLLQDYFELYLPVYSSQGWEIGEPNYGERIRFIVTLSPNTLIGLFTRRWF
jgi:hypothetical protein